MDESEVNIQSIIVLAPNDGIITYVVAPSVRTMNSDDVILKRI